MKYAGKTFTLYASEPVAVQGSDSLYTYQNTGTGTATLQGSNNGKDWVTITTVTSGASSISSHSYAFLRMTGSTEVSVSRGEAGSGSTLLNGSAVSSSNPLPVVSKKSKRVSITGITVAASAHAAKTVCGGLLTTTGILTSGIDTGVLVSVSANFKPAVTGVYVLHGFSSQPSTIADNAAFALTAEDCDKKVCTIPLTLAAYNNTGGVIKASFQVSNIQHAIESTAGQMWWYLVTETAWTPTSTTDLYDITIGVAKD